MKSPLIETKNADRPTKPESQTGRSKMSRYDNGSLQKNSFEDEQWKSNTMNNKIARFLSLISVIDCRSEQKLKFPSCCLHHRKMFVNFLMRSSERHRMTDMRNEQQKEIY